MAKLKMIDSKNAATYLFLEFQFAGGLVFFEEFAKFLRYVEQAHPLFIIERDRKTAEAVHADTAFFSDAKIERAAAFAALLFF